MVLDAGADAGWKNPLLRAAPEDSLRAAEKARKKATKQPPRLSFPQPS